MRYLTIVVLFLIVTIATGCSRGPAATAKPVEKSVSTTIPTHTATLIPTTVDTVTAIPTRTPEPRETPDPSLDTERTQTSTPTAMNSAPPTAEASGESAVEEPLLRMVHIRAKSPLEVSQLRQMGLDIATVRSVTPDPNQPPGKEFPAGRDLPPGEALPPRDEFVVEAVITSEILVKLRAMGFEVTEVP